MSGLTPTGFVAKTFDEILAELAADQRTRFAALGESLDVRPGGLIDRINRSYAAELMECWTALEQIYNAHGPDTAIGIAVDHIGALSGNVRLNRKKSSVMLHLTLAENTTVVAGSVVSMDGAPSVRFATLATVQTGIAGAVLEVRAQADAFGHVVAEAGTVWHIESPVPGWTDVTNLEAAQGDADVETDADYRRRRVVEISSQGGSTYAGILADLHKLDGILSVVEIQNDTDYVSADGLPPHSFEVIVHGDVTDADVGACILKNKPAGAQAYGTTPVTVTDPDGVEHVVSFTRATPVPINVVYLGDFGPGYAAGDLKKAVVADTLDPKSTGYFAPGRAVYPVQLMAAAARAGGVLNLALSALRAPAVPANDHAAFTAGIPIGMREVATIGLWSGNDGP